MWSFYTSCRYWDVKSWNQQSMKHFPLIFSFVFIVSNDIQETIIWYKNYYEHSLKNQTYKFRIIFMIWISKLQCLKILIHYKKSFVRYEISFMVTRWLIMTQRLISPKRNYPYWLAAIKFIVIQPQFYRSRR